MRFLLDEARAAGALLDNRENDEAAVAFRAVNAKLRAAGITSAQVSRGLAIALDYLDRVDQAFDAILNAAKSDPLSPGVNHSLDVICVRLREKLTAMDATDERIPKWYGMLFEVGRADVDVRIALVNHLAATGRTPEARRHAEALTLVFADSAATWLTLAALARAAGDTTVAEEAGAKAQSVAEDGPLTSPKLNEGKRQ